MKNYTYIGISFIVLIFGILVIPNIVARFKKSDLMVVGRVPQFELTDQNNKTITQKDYDGKVYAVEFFFSTCPTICPIMKDNMLKLQTEFYANQSFGIASISIDPKNDTVEALKAYGERIGVKIPNWHLLTGDGQYVYNLAEKDFKLNAGVDPNSPGGFYHSGSICIIDKEGNIRSRKDDYGNPIVYYDGLTAAGLKMLKQDIKKLLAE